MIAMGVISFAALIGVAPLCILLTMRECNARFVRLPLLLKAYGLCVLFWLPVAAVGYLAS